MNEIVKAGDLLVSPEAYPALQSAQLDSCRAFLEFGGGTRICHKRGRSVVRLEIGGRAFFLKRNRWHWVEFWKRLSRFRLPDREARREWDNIRAVRAVGIPTVRPVAMGEKSAAGLETASFLLTEELYGAVPLDTMVRQQFLDSGDPNKRRQKRGLIRRVASLARLLHSNGMNHQDFYLNHLFVGPDGMLYLLDLQRVQRRAAVPRRFRIKDLAQLNYSARCIGGFSRTDHLRFLLAYLQTERLGDEGKQLARQTEAKTARIARHDIKLMARRRRRGELPPAEGQ